MGENFFGRRHPESAAVEVWTAADGDRSSLIELLSDDERAHARELRAGDHRDRYVTAHAMLRSVLGARTSMDPTVVRIARRPCQRCGEAHGKPFLADDESTSFSLSHSGDIAVVVVGSGRELGIDVEDRAKKRDIAALAKRTLSVEERRFFDASGADAGCFLRLWTRKEALLKATGAGITRRLSGVAIPPNARTVSIDGLWTLHDLDLPAGYIGALAVEGTGADVRLCRWEP